MKKIKIVGVGSGGNNAVNHMLESNIKGVDFIAIDGRTYWLEKSRADNRILLNPDFIVLGQISPERRAKDARERHEEIAKAINGADIVFIIAGMGGEVGTGASPVIAQIAKNLGILTVSIVTMPFFVERKRRAMRAKEGIDELKNFTDALFAINLDVFLSEQPKIEIWDMQNDSATPIVVTISEKPNPSIADAFKRADNAMCFCVQCLISRYTNLDEKPI